MRFAQMSVSDLTARPRAWFPARRRPSIWGSDLFGTDEGAPIAEAPLSPLGGQRLTATPSKMSVLSAPATLCSPKRHHESETGLSKASQQSIWGLDRVRRELGAA
jgi:hypothetical protein